MATRILVVDGYAPSRQNPVLFIRSLGPEYAIVGEAALAVGAVDCVAKPALVETIPAILAGIAARRQHPGGKHSAIDPPTVLPFPS